MWRRHGRASTMTAEALFAWIEGVQALVATVGLTVALLEWRSVMRLRLVADTEGQRILAAQAAFVETLRALVHVVILGTAAIALALPTPPEYMPHWISQALVARKIGFLLVALIATAGTVSSRRARRAFARAREAQEA